MIHPISPFSMFLPFNCLPHAIALYLPFSNALTLLHYISVHHLPLPPSFPPCLPPSLPLSLPPFPSLPPSVVLERKYTNSLCLASHRGSPWSGELADTECAIYRFLAQTVELICFCVILVVLFVIVCACSYTSTTVVVCFLQSLYICTLSSPSASTSTCRVWKRVSCALHPLHQLPVFWSHL